MTDVMPGCRSVTTTKIGDTSAETVADQPQRGGQPRRPIAPIPQPVQWGSPLPFERRAFDQERARRRGCETAAGLDLIGEL